MYIINVTFLQLNLIKAFANVRILLYINSTTDKSDDTHLLSRTSGNSYWSFKDTSPQPWTIFSHYPSSRWRI